MMRWRFIGIRLLVLVVVLLLLRWTMGPLAQYIAVRSLEAATGAKAEIVSTEVGLFPPRFQMTGVTLADPRKEMRNLFAADHIDLAINGDGLLRRRYEVSRARITGIKLGGQRAASGWLEVVPTEPDPSDGPSLLQKWCDTLAGDAETKMRGFVDGLATVREAERIRAYWEAEYATLRQQAKTLEADIRALQANVKSIDNPLRDIPLLQESLRKVESVRERLALVRQQLDALPARVQGDFQSLDTARRIDQEKVAGFLPEGLDANPASLGPELLGELVKDHLRTVREYLDSGRSLAKATVASPKAERARGETVLLGPEFPSWRIAECQLEGLLSIDSEQYRMQGVVENISSDTDKLNGPLHARLLLEGPRVVRVDYQKFFDTPVSRDVVKIHWPSLDLPSKRLGRSHDAALVIDGGKLELWVELESIGEEMTGRLVSRQKETRVDLATSADLDRLVVVQSLKQNLAAIHQVDIDARFRGSWQNIEMDLQTNLTSCIADSIQRAVNDQVAASRRRLEQSVEQAYTQQTNELQQWLGQQQSGARELVAQTDQIIAEMNQRVAKEIGSADAYLGKLRAGLGKALK